LALQPACFFPGAWAWAVIRAAVAAAESVATTATDTPATCQVLLCDAWHRTLLAAAVAVMFMSASGETTGQTIVIRANRALDAVRS
jgi:hypothetical protein